MNDLLNSLFAENGLDVEAVASHEVLDKIAADEGLDLSALSIEQVAGLIADLEGGEKVAEKDNSEEAPVVVPQVAEKTAAKETTMSDHVVTVAQVAQELHKIAAASGVDLTTLSKEQYAAEFDKVAAAMQDPAYLEKRAEMEQKIAEADMLGRVMAASFHDQLSKLAGDMPPWMGGKKDGDKSDKDEKHEKEESKKEESEEEKKASFDRAVEERAIAIAMAAGYDPASGVKVAGDEQIRQAAFALLKSKGYPVEG